MEYRVMRCVVFTLGMGLILGCGGPKGPKTADVSGTVSLDGKPAEGIVVNFHTEKHVGTGVTGPGGKYSLVQGAEAGLNKVFFTLVNKEAAKDAVDTGMDSGQMEASTVRVAPTEKAKAAGLPEQYSDPEKSPITFQVPDGGTSNADFKLTSS